MQIFELAGQKTSSVKRAIQVVQRLRGIQVNTGKTNVLEQPERSVACEN